MKNVFKSLFLFIFFLLILAGSVYGVLTPVTSSTAAVGNMEVTTAQVGLTLTQNFTNVFYNFSPFNDYLVINGTRENLITYKEIENKTYKSSYPPSHVKAIEESIKSYFRLDTPKAEFSDSKKIAYSTLVSGNKLTVEKSVTSAKNPQILGSTISFNSGDLVYDPNGNLYTFTNDSNLKTLESVYGVKLTPKLEELYISLPGKTVYIYNPGVYAVIAVKASKNQTIKIDRNSKLIEIEEIPYSKNGVYKSSINIYVFKNPKEAKI